MSPPINVSYKVTFLVDTRKLCKPDDLNVMIWGLGKTMVLGKKDFLKF